VVGKYGDGHILDEETILAALAGLTAERDQARERADFVEGTARDMAKQDRERKDDLEMDVRRIRMAMEHMTNATERLGEMTVTTRFLSRLQSVVGVAQPSTGRSERGLAEGDSRLYKEVKGVESRFERARLS
jgi:hypothetical protein